MNDIHIKPELLRVLKQLKQKEFTVAELTQAYIADPDSSHRSKKGARQFVYRNMVRLIKAGQMVKLSANEGWPRYKLSPTFCEPTNAPDANVPNAPHQPEPASLEKHPPLPVHTLKERLSKHRSDMLCAMGEAEEYNALCAELPELRAKAQELYNEARERSAILLGKIKALESLLTHPVSPR
jgi:hypothetical protein